MNIPAEILVNGKWRPTRNSNGKLIHSTPEGILAFWKWFGDSKVVDDQGRPLVVYHGSSKKLTEFKTDGDGIHGRGAYFTPLKSRAREYGRNVVSVYLHIENMRIIRYGFGADRESEADPSVDGIAASRANGMVMEYVVRSPSQIKSAIGNRGTFDPEDPVMMNPPSYPVMSYAAAHKWEALARQKGVSEVARSSRGFMRAYQRAGSWKNLPEAWKRKRNAFVARHMAQGKKEQLWKGGTPSRRALALIMWAYMPPKRNQIKEPEL